jgi:hypothetical protein
MRLLGKRQVEQKKLLRRIRMTPCQRTPNIKSNHPPSPKKPLVFLAYHIQPENPNFAIGGVSQFCFPDAH